MPLPSRIPSHLLNDLDDQRKRHELGIMLDDLIKRLNELDSTVHSNYVTIIGNMHDAATEGPGIDLVGQQVGLGGDTILVYHSDGNPASEYDATSAGLTAAAGALSAGDIILLPSRTITLSAGLTLPAGAGIIGMGDKSVLSFSGFGGTGIRLAESCMLFNFVVNFESNDMVANGINNEDATDSAIVHVRVTVNGGAYSNIAIGPPPDLAAKVAWMLHSSATADPPVAVIYQILDDFNAPVYNSIIPPPELYIDKLYYGNYSPSADALILVGHATQTPEEPGWGGGAGYVTLRVTDPLGTPVWSLVNINSAGIDFPTSGGGYSIYGQASRDLDTIRVSAHYTADQWLARCAPYDLNPHPAVATYVRIYGNTYDDNDPMACSPLPIELTAGYAYAGWNMYGGGVGPMPDGWSPPNAEHGWIHNYATNTGPYEYAAPGVESGGSTALIALRKRTADNGLEIINLPSLSWGFPNGDPAPWNVAHVLDESGAVTPTPYWTNTYFASQYTALIITGGYLYYRTPSGGWAKMAGTIPIGFAHFYKLGGSRELFWMGTGAVTNGGTFARFTHDVADLTGSPWIDMPGNMWTEIIQSGDLFIADSFLSFS